MRETDPARHIRGLHTQHLPSRRNPLRTNERRNENVADIYRTLTKKSLNIGTSIMRRENWIAEVI